MNNITIYGVNFNIEWAKTKTYKQFLEHFKHLFKELTEDERENNLKKVWETANKVEVDEHINTQPDTKITKYRKEKIGKKESL